MIFILLCQTIPQLYETIKKLVVLFYGCCDGRCEVAYNSTGCRGVLPVALQTDLVMAGLCDVVEAKGMDWWESVSGEVWLRNV